MSIDDVIRESLRTFANDVFGRRDWQGKEHEAVSLYAFGHLIRHVDDDGAPSDAAQ